MDRISEIKVFLTQNAVLISVAAFMVIMLILGWRRGFMVRLIALGSLILTIMAEIRFFPYVYRFLENNESIHNAFKNFGRSLMHFEPGHSPSPLYDILGLDILADNASEAVTELAARIVCLIVIFIAVRIALHLLSFIARGLKKISIIDRLDKLLGAALGSVEGLIYVWVFMFVVSGLPDVKFCRFVLDQIVDSGILSALYEQNIIVQFVADLLR